jgi:hypothetical protein
VSKAVPTGFDKEATDDLLQAGVESALSNADHTAQARGELPLGERALPSDNRKVAEIGDMKGISRRPWVSAKRGKKR